MELTEEILAASDYFIYPHQGIDLIIFGRAWTKAEVDACGDSWESTDYKQNGGYIFGDWASVACVNGELGSNHFTRCRQITRECYQAAQAANWDAVVILL